MSRKREVDVISREKHIEALDFDPTTEMVFWVDSKDRKIKRSYMLNARAGEVKVGYAQELPLKGTCFKRSHLLLSIHFIINHISLQNNSVFYQTNLKI